MDWIRLDVSCEHPDWTGLDRVSKIDPCPTLRHLRDDCYR